MSKKILSLLLVITLLLSSIPSFATEVTETMADGDYYLKTTNLSTRKSDFLDVIVQDSQIYVSVESWNNIVNPEVITFNSYTNRWMVAGAGKFKFAIAENGNCINTNGSKYIQGFTLNPNTYPLIIKDNMAYFPLFPTMFNLGISGICSEDSLLLYVPGSTEAELTALSRELMRDWGPMEVNTVRDKDEGFWEKQSDNILITLDITFDIIANAKFVEVAKETYVEDLLEDAIIGSLAGQSHVSINETEDAWDGWNGFTWAISQAKLPDDSMNVYTEVFLGDDVADILYNSKINPVEVGNVLLGTYVDYFTKTQKINAIACGNLVRAINIFDNDMFDDDYPVKKIVKKVTKEYVESSADMNEIVAKNIVNGTASIAFDMALDEILTAPAKWAKLYLDVTLVVMQKLTDYNYGDLSTLMMYEKFQNSIKYAYELKKPKNDGSKEYYQYLHDCAMLYSQVKQASFAFMKSSGDIRTGYATQEIYADLCSILPQDIWLSNNAESMSYCDTSDLLNMLIDKNSTVEINPNDFLNKFGLVGEYQYVYIYDLDVDGSLEYMIAIKNQTGGIYNAIIDVNDFLMLVDGAYYRTPTGWKESLLIDENGRAVFKTEISTQYNQETIYSKYNDNYSLRKGSYMDYKHCYLNYVDISNDEFALEESKFKPFVAEKQTSITLTIPEQIVFLQTIEEMFTLYDAVFPHEYYVEGEDVIELNSIEKNPDKTMAAISLCWMEWDDYCNDYIGMAQTDYVDLENMHIIRTIGGGVSEEDETFMRENGWIS